MTLTLIDVDTPNNLSEDTPIYKYLSIEAFLYLIVNKKLILTKISDWPDRFEGEGFNFFNELCSDDKHFGNKASDFNGTCWTLHKEEEIDLDILKEGSVAMWESYCKSGGVRIKTTIKKVKSQIKNESSISECYHGKVHYEPSWDKMEKAKNLVDRLFIKRSNYRYESEYRFIIFNPDDDILSIQFNDLKEFIIEILVCPNIKSKEWISKTLYELGKSQKIDMGISQLYSYINLE